MEKLERDKILFNHVSVKIQKGQKLKGHELQEWIKNNFLNLQQKEHDDIQYWFRRRNNMRILTLILWPIAQVPLYTYFKRYRYVGNFRSLLLSGLIYGGAAFLLNYRPTSQLYQ